MVSFIFVGIVTLALVLIVFTGVKTVLDDPKKSITFTSYC